MKIVSDKPTRFISPIDYRGVKCGATCSFNKKFLFLKNPSYKRLMFPSARFKSSGVFSVKKFEDIGKGSMRRKRENKTEAMNL